MRTPKTQKLTNFKPLQDEVIKLRNENKELLEALKEIADYHDRCSSKGNPVLSRHWESLVKSTIRKSEKQ